MSETLGPLPQGLDLVVNKGGTANIPGQPGEDSLWSIQGQVATRLGVQGLSGPSVDVSTSGTGFNVWGWAKADAGGSASTWVRFVAKPDAPVVLGYVPVLFSATGSGSFSGNGLNPYGALSLQAWLSVDSSDGSDPFPVERFKASGQGVNGTASFADAVSLALHQGYYNPFFELRVNANCSSMAFGSNNADRTAPSSGSASCGGSVLTALAFDQAAFDANPSRYGATQAFKLADYYTMEYSANMPAVPEPSSWAMLAAGLGLLAGCARRRRTAGTGGMPVLRVRALLPALLGAGLLGGNWTSAQAEQVTYSFSTTVTRFNAAEAPAALQGHVAIGSLVTGTLTYDSSSLPASNPFPSPPFSEGTFYKLLGSSSLDLQIADVQLRPWASESKAAMVWREAPSLSGRDGIWFWNDTADVFGAGTFVVGNTNLRGGTFTSNSLPNGADLSLTLYARKVGAGLPWLTTGLFTATQPVPEPSSWLMMANGIGLLALWRMRRRCKT